ncbi:ParB/RepB/Spo0J family partition protein [Vibrio breoganii]
MIEQATANEVATNTVDATTPKFDKGEFRYLDPKELLDTPWRNQRSQRDPKSYEQTKNSIKANGMHTPLQVRVMADGSHELVAGYGRRQIALELGLKTVLCVVRVLSDVDAKFLMASENIDREQLSPIDEAKAAQDLIAEFNGDLQAVSATLGWSVKKLKQYLQLLLCSPSVLDQLNVKQENGFILSMGHANELSTLPESNQDSVLPVLISEKWSVSALRKNITTIVERDLETAIFNTANCQNCNSNSSFQTSLFDDFEGGKCRNPACFQEKEESHLNQQMLTLQKDYGQVIFLSHVEGKFTETSKEIVGEKKFVDQCLSCSSYVAILANKGENKGEVLEDKCINPKCANEKDTSDNASAQITDSISTPTAPKKRKTVKVVAKVEPQSTDETATENAEVVEVEVEVPTKNLMTTGTINDAKNYIRTQTSEVLLNTPQYYLAMNLVALRNLHAPMSDSTLNAMVSAMLTKDVEEISKLIHQEIGSITKEIPTNNNFQALDNALSIGKHVDCMEQVQANWKPTASNLKTMRKGLRVQILEQSGFAKAYTEKHSEKEYNALIKEKEDEQIEAILGFDFDWTHYCPEYVIKTLEQA